MLNPDTTLKLMREGFWGARAMERRVIKCCAENPDCSFQDECTRQYDKFVTATEMPVRSELTRKNDIERQKRNYHRLREAGIGSRVAARNLTNRRTQMLLQRAGDV